MEVLSKADTEEVSSDCFNTPNYITMFISKIESETEERLAFVAEFADFNMNRSSAILCKDALEMLSNNQILMKKGLLNQFFAALCEVPIPIKSRDTLSKILIKFLTKYSISLSQDIVFSILKTFCLSLKVSSLDRKTHLKLSSAIAYYLKTKENEQANFVSLVNENNRNVNFIFLAGLMIKEKLNCTESLEKVFLAYYEKYVLDDYDRDKNLITQNLFIPILPYLSQSSILDCLLPSCESLMKRSKNNYVFIANVLSNTRVVNDNLLKIIFNEDFTAYFFSLEDKIFNCALKTYQNIISLLSSIGINLLIDELLNLDYSADKNDLNINVCYYLTELLHDFTGSNKVSTRNLEVSQILKIVNFIFKKGENASDNTKGKYEKIFENLLKGLLQVEATGTPQSINKQLVESFFNQSKKLTTNSFSYLFNLTFHIIKVTFEKSNLFEIAPKGYFDVFFNQLTNSSISISNYKNPISIMSLCLCLAQKSELFNNNKKVLSAGYSNLFRNSEFKDFTSNTFLYKTLSNFDAINILDSLRYIIKNRDLIDVLGEEINEIFKIVSQLILSKNLQKSFEVKTFNQFIEKYLTEKEFADQLLDNILVNTFNNFNNYPLEKLSFQKVAKICLKYLDFYTEFTEKDFVKFIFIANMPNLNYDINILCNSSTNFVKKVYSILEKQLNVNIFDKFESHFDLFSQLIFSEIGINNTHIPLMKETSICILNKMIEKESLMKSIFEIIVQTLDINKFKYIDKIYKHYTSQIDYVTFYDLSYIVDQLKNLESTYLNKLTKIEVKEKEVIANITTKKGAKQTQKPAVVQKVKQTQKPQQTIEKVDKELKYKNDKSYVDYFILRIQLNIKQNFSALLLILSKINNKDAYKEYFRNFIKVIWKLMKVDFLRDYLKSNLIQLFKENNLISKMRTEFVYFMIVSKLPNLLDSVLEIQPNLINSLNEKLEKIVNTDNEIRTKIFEYFDYLIVKFLFFIILNNHISNEDKILSVDIIIKIMDNFKNLINFDKISKLVKSLLKSTYNSENISSLISMFFKKAPEQNFLSLCSDILEFESVPKQAFLEQIIKLQMTSLKKYKNLVYKIWILLFDDNELISNVARDLWNKFNLYIDHDFLKSQEINIAFTDNRNNDLVHKSIISKFII